MSKLPTNVKKAATKQLKLDKLVIQSPGKTARARSKSPEQGPPRKKPNSQLNSEDEVEAKKQETKQTFPVFQSGMAASSTGNTKSPCQLAEEIKCKRNELFESVNAFRFNKKRVQVLTEAREFPEDAQGILYWMSRDQRVQDNWALLYAQKLALKQNLPLYVCFCLVPTFLNATIRQYHFMLEGLKEVQKELTDLNIQFHLLIGLAKDQVPKFVAEHKIGGLICDFSPLRTHKNWLQEMRKNLPSNVPLAQVDAHNVVPCWIASDKLEYAARTIRNKINSKLDEYLSEFPPVISHPVPAQIDCKPIDWDACFKSLECDQSVKIVKWASPGYLAGIKNLEDFIQNRLKNYDSDRNDPNKNSLSNMSPWYHFGQVSVQRCMVEVKKYASKFSNSVKGLMEETIVRRELADNFCYYQPNYDNINGANEWAKISLDAHRKDKRPALYSLSELENFKTADKLWNASQIQMRVEGKMHGFMRMYWAKKILEWTESPEQALEYSIYLNDKYNLDGRDPNGYVGCMWSICGIHDQGWAERAVFGKVRYMNFEGCKRKFDIERYCLKYMAKKSEI
ncbi:deoxyribodipyrimidine photo-lyase-like [Brachionus plicatilis]|uniref:Deoxyribodipyrimidine photo-lyase n=1 Tax=Brachionus plicatilis TaxID=10195 RepID=A0A3M7QL57_BRAPC|nr:deoxyribodipyrimidine photo-lyase-like [Brachionus plicatilis]